MMKRIALLLLLGWCLAGAETTLAQAVRPEFDIDLAVGIPQGEFAEHIDDFGIGITGFAGVGLGRSPLLVGIELGAMTYGTERRKEAFSTTIPDVTVDVETSNNLVTGHLVLRLQPASGIVRPYVDGLVGLKYLYTDTRIENERNGNEEPIATATNFEDTAFSYGAGGGIDIRVYYGPLGKEEGASVGAVSINLGVRYLYGSEAEYLKKGSIRRENGKVAYDVERSKTDLLVPQVGVRFSL